MKINSQELHWSNSAQIVVAIFGGLATLLYFLTVQMSGGFPIQGPTSFLLLLAMILFTIFVVLFIHKKPALFFVPLAIYFGCEIVMCIDAIFNALFYPHFNSLEFWILIAWATLKIVLLIVIFVLLVTTFLFGRNKLCALIVTSVYFGIASLVFLYTMRVFFSLYTFLANLSFFIIMVSIIVLLATLQIKKVESMPVIEE